MIETEADSGGNRTHNSAAFIRQVHAGLSHKIIPPRKHERRRNMQNNMVLNNHTECPKMASLWCQGTSTRVLHNYPVDLSLSSLLEDASKGHFPSAKEYSHFTESCSYFSRSNKLRVAIVQLYFLHLARVQTFCHLRTVRLTHVSESACPRT